MKMFFSKIRFTFRQKIFFFKKENPYTLFGFLELSLDNKPKTAIVIKKKAVA
jgi:hypothetical protein